MSQAPTRAKTNSTATAKAEPLLDGKVDSGSAETLALPIKADAVLGVKAENRSESGEIGELQRTSEQNGAPPAAAEVPQSDAKLNRPGLTVKTHLGAADAACISPTVKLADAR